MSARLSRQGMVAVVTLDDGKANAFRPDSLATLDAALEDAFGSDAGALMIEGRPGFFSGGLDLRVVPSLSRDDRRAMFHHFARLMLRVWRSPVPTVAAVGGHALAGGAILALACDDRVGIEGPYKFGLNEVALGVPLPGFAVEMARAVVSGTRLLELTAHARVSTFAEAQALGVLSAVAPAESFREAALGRAAALAALPRAAYATTKASVLAPLVERVERGFDAEIDAFVLAFEAGLKR